MEGHSRKVGCRAPDYRKENQLVLAMLRKSKTIGRSTLANTPCKTNPNNTTQTTQTSQTNPGTFREGETRVVVVVEGEGCGCVAWKQTSLNNQGRIPMSGPGLAPAGQQAAGNEHLLV